MLGRLLLGDLRRSDADAEPFQPLTANLELLVFCNEPRPVIVAEHERYRSLQLVHVGRSRLFGLCSRYDLRLKEGRKPLQNVRRGVAVVLGRALQLRNVEQIPMEQFDMVCHHTGGRMDTGDEVIVVHGAIRVPHGLPRIRAVGVAKHCEQGIAVQVKFIEGVVAVGYLTDPSRGDHDRFRLVSLSDSLLQSLHLFFVHSFSFLPFGLVLQTGANP